jgi:hypothetical protein
VPGEINQHVAVPKAAVKLRLVVPGMRLGELRNPLVRDAE